MDVVSRCPLRVASLRWQASPWRWALTVIAKATFHLVPVTCTLANEQEDPIEHENHWDDDPRRSLYAPSDFVPYKPQPEVTLVGNAFAPQGEPVSWLAARLIVGNVDKSIVVHRDRSFAQDGTMHNGVRFRRMPLRYERAAGGPETSNPVGMVRARDTLGAVLLPNLEPPGLNVTRPDDHIDPIGFAPIPADWPTRRERLGHHAGHWSPAALGVEPMPEWLDQRFFMSAPPDQYLDELRANERIVLENLHPDHARLVTSLPGLEPRAFVQRPLHAAAELPMTCDTLWIDTDRSICTVTWRARFGLEDRDQQGRVVIGMARLGEPLAWSDVRSSEREPSEVERTFDGSGSPPGLKRSPAMRFTGQQQRQWPSWLASGREGEAPAGGRIGTSTGTLDVQSNELKEAIEAAVVAAGAAKVLAAAAEVPPPALVPAPTFGPPPTVPMVQPVPLAPAHPDPPYPPAQPAMALGLPSPSQPAMALGLASPSPPAMTMGQQFAAAAEPRGMFLSSSAPAGEPARPPAASRPAIDVREAATQGAAAASNAAATAANEASAPVARDRDAPAPAAREAPRDHVDLLWYEPEAVPRLQKAFAGALPPRPAVTWLAGDTGVRETPDAKARREVLTILSRGSALDEAALAQVANGAYQDDGTFAVPIALVAGEISFGFDELETLRSTITVVTPFAGTDKKLKDAVAGGTEVIKSEWGVTADVAEGTTRRIEEAFAQGQRSVAPKYLESSVEKLLLEGRRYQKKNVFGAQRIRALFAASGGSGAPIPTYLPEALAPKLPLFRRFKVKAVVEVRPQEDQYETHADALLVLALGRLLHRGN